MLQHVYDNKIDNVFAVTGDTHANWLFENNLETTLQGSNDTSTLKTIETTTNEYQRGTIVEFGGTAVSSSGWGNSWGSYENSTVGAKAMVENNPTLLYADGFSKSLLLIISKKHANPRPRIHDSYSQLHPRRNFMVRIPRKSTGSSTRQQAISNESCG